MRFKSTSEVHAKVLQDLIMQDNCCALGAGIIQCLCWAWLCSSRSDESALLTIFCRDGKTECTQGVGQCTNKRLAVCTLGTADRPKLVARYLKAYQFHGSPLQQECFMEDLQDHPETWQSPNQT